MIIKVLLFSQCNSTINISEIEPHGGLVALLIIVNMVPFLGFALKITVLTAIFKGDGQGVSKLVIHL